MTPLGRVLARRIAAQGPISVAAYMTACLADETHGYYRTAAPLGASGDFITAPEASQIFGELLGLWLAQVWGDLGRPDPVIVAELGPGRGVMMADARRAIARAMPAFAAAMRLHLIEIHPGLRAAQGTLLGDAAPVWHDSCESLPDGPLLILANEFLDALPVRQFVRERATWRERQVGFDGEHFRFVAGDAPPESVARRLDDDAPDGTICEIRPGAEALAEWTARRLVADSGAALFVDYGSAASGWGDTLQAVRRHAKVDPLAAPGEADLSAQVDFAAFAAAASGAGGRVHGPVPQANFLRRLGIDARAAALLRTATPPQAKAIEDGYRSLIDSGRMGTLFKAVAIATPHMTTLPGFDPLPTERDP